jgi:hypothetical protein
MVTARPGGRRALVSTGAAVLLAACGASPAEARTRCSLSGPPDNALTVTADKGALTEILRRGSRIVVRELLESPARCAGGVPTVLNTDTIRVTLRTDDDFLDLYLAGGPFAPGATPEEEGAAEIEIEVTAMGPTGGLATVHGTRRADEFVWGPGTGPQPGLNLNPRAAGDVDADVVGSGGLGSLLLAEGGPGDDSILPAEGAAFANVGVFAEGGPGDDRLAAFPNSHATLLGDEGDDVLSGGELRDDLIGGDGDDRIDGGSGADFIDGGHDRDLIRAGPGRDAIFSSDRWRDRVLCGAGRDRVTADRRDRLRGCELVSR